MRVVLALVQEKMPRYVDAKIYDIQVLTPMRKGVLGVEHLNRCPAAVSESACGRQGRAADCPGGMFREGDKVMQVQNNYQIEWEANNRYGIAIDKGTGDL